MHTRIREILDASCVPYQVHLHKQFSIPIHSPNDFARALGYDVSRITKTLLLQSATDAELFCVVVVSSNKRVNLNTIANVLSCKRVRMANQPTLARVLAYPPTGVSRIGVGSIPVFIDQQLMEFPTILIGAGEVGCEIEISPQALQQLTEATVLSLVS